MFGYCDLMGNQSGPFCLGATEKIAVIYMEEFPIRVLETNLYPLDQWYWYDDSEMTCWTDQFDEM